ncbi:MAG TPA: hypothetical protein VMB52_06395 [Verrucomicrobiae bacterium]|nr:hypothetical protein [Verrucomicrobiae bacterium]
MTETIQPEPQHESPFDTEGVVGVPLSSTDYLLDKFRSDTDPGSPEPEVYVTTNEGGRELLPAGMLIVDKEFEDDGNGGRVPDGDGGYKSHPIVTGYVDTEHHLHLFTASDVGPDGRPQVPGYVSERTAAMTARTGIQPEVAEPALHNAKIVMSRDVADDILAQQDDEAYWQGVEREAASLRAQARDVTARRETQEALDTLASISDRQAGTRETTPLPRVLDTSPDMLNSGHRRPAGRHGRDSRPRRDRV